MIENSVVSLRFYRDNRKFTILISWSCQEKCSWAICWCVSQHTTDISSTSCESSHYEHIGISIRDIYHSLCVAALFLNEEPVATDDSILKLSGRQFPLKFNSRAIQHNNMERCRWSSWSCRDQEQWNNDFNTENIGNIENYKKTSQDKPMLYSSICTYLYLQW